MYHQMIPMGIISALLIISATSIFKLPETLNKQLPNGIDDVERVWGNGRSSSQG